MWTVWITLYKNIGSDTGSDTLAIDFEYAFVDSRFIEIYKQIDENAKYELTNFEKYLINLIVNGYIMDWDLEPPNTSCDIPLIASEPDTSSPESSDEDESQTPESQIFDTLGLIGSLLE